MFKKSVVKKLGGYSNLRFLEDYDLWVKMLTAGFKIVNVPETLVNMRMSDSLYSRQGCNWFSIKIDLLNEVVNFDNFKMFLNSFCGDEVYVQTILKRYKPKN